jgi:hypothetical protein
MSPGSHTQIRHEEDSFFMDGKRFDSLAKKIGRRRSRRDAFQALATAALAAAATRIGLGAESAEAQVAVEQRFNCKAVGEKCNGKDSACCSGRCQGKGAKKGRKRKNGKRRKDRPDRSKCIAHDQGSCTGTQDTCDTGKRVACGSGTGGGCLQTTGKANFCGQVQTGTTPPRLKCEVCEKDSDCVNKGYGRDAACVVCESSCEFENGKATACAGAWD